MERIKEALDRARQQREAQRPAEEAGDAPVVPAREQRAQPVSPLDIEYTATRVATPDPVVMRNRRVVAHETGAGDALADAYRMLRTRTLRTMEEHNWHTLAITSPGAGEGKSLTAVNLGLSIAREIDRTVLLVDLDLRRPGLHQFFGIDVEHGIADYLRDDVALDHVLVNPAVERFVLLPGNGRVENSSELLTSPRMRSLAEELAQRYPERVVIFDLPPVLAVDDALAFSPFVDAFLLVVEEGRTQAQEIAAAHDVLAGSNIVGTVLNKAAESQGHYYY